MAFKQFTICFSLLMAMQTASAESLFPCLPPGRKLADIVSAEVVRRDASGKYFISKVSIEDKLVEMKAHCDNGKLVDGSGKEIVFYQLAGCWGTPPAGYQEIMQRQRTEIEDLKKSFSVIELSCNPEGFPAP